MTFYAHTSEDETGARLPLESGAWQPLSNHLRNVAALARSFASPLGLAQEAELSGLLHDLGKYTNEFQSYLRGQLTQSAETQHAIYGAAWALNPHQQLGAVLAVAGHHAGLHNVSDTSNAASKPAIRSQLAELVRRLESELGPLPAPPGIPALIASAPEPALATEFYVRMLFSCLVDADRLDTASWPNSPKPDRPLDPEALLERVAAERELKQTSNPGSPLAAIRNEIFAACGRHGTLDQGFFSLTVPTGGGKTLASLHFALAHARSHGLRRVIFVIPYLSIIEQNAAEYRRILGPDVVLEQHSNASPSPDATEEERSTLELASENWDAPVIVTTSVQFLESLFASSPSKCRKLHRIARSVVVFDEVQTLPAHLLKPSFSVFRELVRSYGVSFVFSSATQPAFRRSRALPDGLESNELRELAPQPADLFRKLRRVNYHLPRPDQTVDWPELAERLAAQSQALCVVNLTRHAKALWEHLSRLSPGGKKPVHLSSAMCPAHRLELIRAIRARLKRGEPCHVISTQLIEAGVDVDFPAVWRAMGPLDSIVQVAGRCNREGRLSSGEVHVFRPADHKLPPGIYKTASDQAAIVLACLDTDPEPLNHDPELFGRYFEALYQVVNTDYARARETTIQHDRENLRYRDVSHKARVIPDSGQPVIILRDNDGHPYAADVVQEIRSRVPSPGQLRFTKHDLRILQKFMVNVPQYNFQRLEGLRHIHPLIPNLELVVANDGFYHPDLGLVIENRPLEDFIA